MTHMCGITKEMIIKRLKDAGACAVGVAAAMPADSDVCGRYNNWIQKKHNAGMGYMANHADVRRDARLLLPGARSIICMAFCYDRGPLRDPKLPEISYYALFPDYHDWIRSLIRNSGVAELLGSEGEDWRLCVDTAPLMERYMAKMAGIGIIGDNGALIVPGVGNRVILAEIITPILLETDSPLAGDCGHCGKCLKACPTGALLADGTIDCNRCLSYLTIEHRGEWTDNVHKTATATSGGRTTLFGCDRCMAACPHNKPGHACRTMPDPLPDIVNLTAEDIICGDQELLRKTLKGSALKRAKAADLLRNACNILTAKGGIAVEATQ